jgi:hypothetical protein
MKVSTQPRGASDPALKQELVQHATLLNLMTDGRLAGTNNAVPAVPTSGTFATGDFIRNSAPTELGAPGSKYVILGWVCVAGGTPGTILQCRVLTGN